MKLYFNEESSWNPEEEYVRGIPSEYDELFSLAEEKEDVTIVLDETVFFNNMVDGRRYGILETRENLFKEYILEVGTYNKDELVLENIAYLEQEHFEPLAKIVRIGEERRETLLEIRFRMNNEGWSSKVIDMEDIEIEDYMPIH